ncbi:flavodoxin family protein [bacterium]|nr:flavodoxin family protein [bacterium]
MKKLLGVMGSPRKNGNTHILVSKILEGAQDSGAQTEVIFLGDLTIRECNGCHACWETGSCSKKDDMIPLYEKITVSDVIVFGTPVYWYGPTALMKGFLDRFVYFNSPATRGVIKGKSAVLAVPYEEDNTETAEPLLTLFRKSFEYLEMNIAGTIIAPGVGGKGEILAKKNLLDKAYELGKKLVG